MPNEYVHDIRHQGPLCSKAVQLHFGLRLAFVLKSGDASMSDSFEFALVVLAIDAVAMPISLLALLAPLLELSPAPLAVDICTRSRSVDLEEFDDVVCCVFGVVMSRIP